MVEEQPTGRAGDDPFWAACHHATGLSGSRLIIEAARSRNDNGTPFALVAKGKPRASGGEPDAFEGQAVTVP